MNITYQAIQHLVLVEFEPRPFDGGYSKGPKMAHALQVRWAWDGEWRCDRATVFYRLVKKDGALYEQSQDATLRREDRDPFEDALTVTEPHYLPEHASSDARPGGES